MCSQQSIVWMCVSYGHESSHQLQHLPVIQLTCCVPIVISRNTYPLAFFPCLITSLISSSPSPQLFSSTFFTSSLLTLPTETWAASIGNKLRPGLSSRLLYWMMKEQTKKSSWRRCALGRILSLISSAQTLFLLQSVSKAESFSLSSRHTLTNKQTGNEGGFFEMHDQTGDLFLVREIDLESLPTAVLTLQIQVSFLFELQDIILFSKPSPLLYTPLLHVCLSFSHSFHHNHHHLSTSFLLTFPSILCIYFFSHSLNSLSNESTGAEITSHRMRLRMREREREMLEVEEKKIHPHLVFPLCESLEQNRETSY